MFGLKKLRGLVGDKLLDSCSIRLGDASDAAEVICCGVETANMKAMLFVLFFLVGGATHGFAMFTAPSADKANAGAPMVSECLETKSVIDSGNVSVTLIFSACTNDWELERWTAVAKESMVALVSEDQRAIMTFSSRMSPGVCDHEFAQEHPSVLADAVTPFKIAEPFETDVPATAASLTGASSAAGEPSKSESATTTESASADATYSLMTTARAAVDRFMEALLAVVFAAQAVVDQMADMLGGMLSESERKIYDRIESRSPGLSAPWRPVVGRAGQAAVEARNISIGIVDIARNDTAYAELSQFDRAYRMNMSGNVVLMAHSEFLVNRTLSCVADWMPTMYMVQNERRCYCRAPRLRAAGTSEVSP